MSWWPTQTVPSAAVIIVPPFAEEMNKCRRMLALQAQALAGAGIVAVHPDLYGTGDSEGDFSDARWSDWLSNVADTAKWARTQVGDCIYLLAVRSGALLALESLPLIVGTPPRRAVLWAPTPSGRSFMTHFLRVQIAADLSSPSKERQSTSALWRQLESGQSIEVAGYRLVSDVALPMRDSDLQAVLHGAPFPVTWFDVSPAGATIGATARRVIDAVAHAGSPVDARPVRGEPFWATPEIAIAPDLIAATTAAFVGLDGQLGH